MRSGPFLLANLLVLGGSVQTQQTRKESRLLHRLDRAVLHETLRSVLIGARLDPAVRAAASVGQIRHGFLHEYAARRPECECAKRTGGSPVFSQHRAPRLQKGLRRRDFACRPGNRQLRYSCRCKIVPPEGRPGGFALSARIPCSDPDRMRGPVSRVLAVIKKEMAGVTGFEPVALGFGDRCSTN